MTLASWSATKAIRLCRNSRRASGSRLATGSSRISRSGRFAMARVSASWARCPPESLPAFCGGSRPSFVMRSSARPVSQRGVDVRAEAQVVGDGQAGVCRGVLGDEADAGQLCGVRGGRSAEHLTCRRWLAACRRRYAAAWSCRRRWVRRDRRLGRRESTACSRIGRCADRSVWSGRMFRSRRSSVLLKGVRWPVRGAEFGGEQRLDAFVVEAGRAGVGSASVCSRARRGAWAATDASVRLRVTKVPRPGLGETRPSCSSSR